MAASEIIEKNCEKFLSVQINYELLIQELTSLDLISTYESIKLENKLDPRGKNALLYILIKSRGLTVEYFRKLMITTKNEHILEILQIDKPPTDDTHHDFDSDQLHLKHSNVNKLEKFWNIPGEIDTTLPLEIINEVEKGLKELNKQKVVNIKLKYGDANTSLALKFANQKRDSFSHGFWFNQKSKSEIKKKIQEIFKSPYFRYKEFKNWLELNPGWIVFLEDIEDEDDFKDFLPEAGGTIIITSGYLIETTTEICFDIDKMLFKKYGRNELKYLLNSWTLFGNLYKTEIIDIAENVLICIEKKNELQIDQLTKNLNNDPNFMKEFIEFIQNFENVFEFIIENFDQIGNDFLIVLLSGFKKFLTLSLDQENFKREVIKLIDRIDLIRLFKKIDHFYCDGEKLLEIKSKIFNEIVIRKGLEFQRNNPDLQKRIVPKFKQDFRGEKGGNFKISEMIESEIYFNKGIYRENAKKEILVFKIEELAYLQIHEFLENGEFLANYTFFIKVHSVHDFENLRSILESILNISSDAKNFGIYFNFSPEVSKEADEIITDYFKDCRNLEKNKRVNIWAAPEEKTSIVDLEKYSFELKQYQNFCENKKRQLEKFTSNLQIQNFLKSCSGQIQKGRKLISYYSQPFLTIIENLKSRKFSENSAIIGTFVYLSQKKRKTTISRATKLIEEMLKFGITRKNTLQSIGLPEFILGYEKFQKSIDWRGHEELKLSQEQKENIAMIMNNPQILIGKEAKIQSSQHVVNIPPSQTLRVEVETRIEMISPKEYAMEQITQFKHYVECILKALSVFLII